MFTNIFRILADKLEYFTLGTVKKDESMNESMKRCKVGLIRTSLDKSRTRNLGERAIASVACTSSC